MHLSSFISVWLHNQTSKQATSSLHSTHMRYCRAADYPLVLYIFSVVHVQTNWDKRGLSVEGVAAYCSVLLWVSSFSSELFTLWAKILNINSLTLLKSFYRHLPRFQSFSFRLPPYFISMHSAVLSYITSRLPRCRHQNAWIHVSVPVAPIFTSDANFEKMGCKHITRSITSIHHNLKSYLRAVTMATETSAANPFRLLR